MFVYCIHGPKEEQPRVEVGSPWLNKVESESESGETKSHTSSK